MNRFLSFLALALLLPAGLVRAQGALEIGTVRGVDNAIPVAVVPMPYLGNSVAPDTDIAAVIRADLNRSGQFRTLAENASEAVSDASVACRSARKPWKATAAGLYTRRLSFRPLAPVIERG